MSRRRISKHDLAVARTYARGGDSTESELLERLLKELDHAIPKRASRQLVGAVGDNPRVCRMLTLGKGSDKIIAIILNAAFAELRRQRGAR